ncbi:hypothetical protein F5884DRAFT_865091 [Xylogone sp. PMI_703]|nr:hypothetical protein F5884DRAFT_865091 [Xylogone sp. PMI_703]
MHMPLILLLIIQTILVLVHGDNSHDYPRHPRRRASDPSSSPSKSYTSLETAKSIVDRAHNFTGYQLYDSNWLSTLKLSPPCQTALTATIECDSYTRQFTEPSYHGALGNDSLLSSVCDPGCGQSLANWYNNVDRACDKYNITGAPPTMLGGVLYKTCLGQNFALGAILTGDRLCKIVINSYSWFENSYVWAQSQCSISGPTEPQQPLIAPDPIPSSICASGNKFTTADGDSCDSVSLAHSVSSAALFMGNPDMIGNRSALTPGMSLCLPFSCQTYTLQAGDTCFAIETAYNLTSLQSFNPWIDDECYNLHIYPKTYRNILCISPPGGPYNNSNPVTITSSLPRVSTGYSDGVVPPLTNQTIAPNTTLNCGSWHTATANDTCTTICVQYRITYNLFTAVNPSLASGDCTTDLAVSLTYCVGPIRAWNETESV